MIEVEIVQMAFDISQGVVVEFLLVVEVVKAPSTSNLGDLFIPDCMYLSTDHSLVDFDFGTPRHGHSPILHSLSIEDIDHCDALA